MEKKKTLVFLVLLLVLGTCFWVACPLDAKVQPKHGGVYRFGMPKSPGKMDPAHVMQETDQFLVTQIYNGLVNVKPGTWEIYPDLAEKYDVSKDKKVYTFYLRKGVKFHNGREMTAKDVVYSLERAKEPIFPNSHHHRNTDKIEAIGDYTVRLTLKKVDNIFLIKMASPRGSGVVPREVVEKFGQNFATSIESTVGTGPFIVKEWNPGRNMILEANANYFRGKPYIDRIEYRVIPEPATEVLEFEKGNLDRVSLKPPYDKQFLSDPKWKPYCESAVYPCIYYVAMDMKVKPFDDIRVRRALAYAWDREKAVQIAASGLGMPSYTMVDPGWEGYDPNVKYYAYNPELAKKLLKEAGYADGITLPVCKVMNFLPMKQYAEFYASDLAKLGIKFKIEIVDTGTHRSERTSGKYPFFMSANSFFLPGAPVFFYEFFHSDNFGPAGNYQKYKNEKVDRYIELMLNETKKEKRIEYIKLAEKQIMEDCPWVLCHLPQRTEALQPWVHGLEGKLIGVTGMWPSINFGNHEIWVEAEKQKR